MRERRGAKLKGEEALLFSGEVFTGRRALGMGLVDGIGELRGVVRGLFGESVRLRLIEPERRRAAFSLSRPRRTFRQRGGRRHLRRCADAVGRADDLGAVRPLMICLEETPGRRPGLLRFARKDGALTPASLRGAKRRGNPGLSYSVRILLFAILLALPLSVATAASLPPLINLPDGTYRAAAPPH